MAINSEWPSVPFAEILALPLRNGLTRPTNTRGSGTKMINMGELFAHSRINNIPMERVPVSEGEATKYLLEPGDLLFARQSLVMSGAGKCSIFLGAKEPVTFEGHLIRARVDVNKGDPTFYYYFFNSIFGRSAIESIIEQVAAAGIRGSDLARLHVPYPSVTIQRTIAYVLGTLDDKIELNRQMNQTLEDMAQALFKSWFVDFEPFRDKGLQDSPLEEIPLGWETKPLDKVANFLNGLAMQKYPPEGDDYLPVIKIAELRKGVTESSGKASPFIDKAYIVKDGDIIFSWSGSLEVCIWCGGDGGLNQHLFKVTSEYYPKWFYYHWIKYHLPEFQAIAAGKATTMGHIQRYHLSNAYVAIPPQDQLEQMHNIMDPIMGQIIQNNIQSRILTGIRDTLLPKLLSGEANLKDLNF